MFTFSCEDYKAYKTEKKDLFHFHRRVVRQEYTLTTSVASWFSYQIKILKLLICHVSRFLNFMTFVAG